MFVCLIPEVFISKHKLQVKGEYSPKLKGSNSEFYPAVTCLCEDEFCFIKSYTLEKKQSNRKKNCER